MPHIVTSTGLSRYVPPLPPDWRDDIPQSPGLVPIQQLAVSLPLARSLIGEQIDVNLKAAKRYTVVNATRVHGEIQLLLADIQGNRHWEFVEKLDHVCLISPSTTHNHATTSHT